MADNIIVTNANNPPSVKLTNMEIKIMAIIAPMNPAITFNFLSNVCRNKIYTFGISCFKIVTPHRYH